MKNSFQKNIYIVLTLIIAILTAMIIVATILSKHMEQKNPEPYISYEPMVQQYEKPEAIEPEVQVETVIIQKNIKTQNQIRPTEKETVTETKSTEENTKVTMATAETQKETTSYQSQWEKGYLLALDYPDAGYNPRHVELSDETRAVVESLCMAQNEAGDFIGAALVAQSLKNAMIYHATDDVMALLDRLHFTRERNSAVSKDVRDAVVYVFDMDKNAVQHRILYNYKPKNDKELSEFHEGKEYVCTYKNIRFFDE